jgi:hypothetical protein
MKRPVIACAGLMAGTVALADNVAGVDRLLCATLEIVVCVEAADCYTVLASEVGVPDFVVIDLDEKLVSTTQASLEYRTTPVANVNRADGLIYLQGIDLGRAFSFVIDEATGRVTVAVSRDGATVTVFGACTDAET